jgi:peroxiredoxin
MNTRMTSLTIRITVTIAALTAIFFIYSYQTPAADDSISPTGNVAVITETGESGKSNVDFSWKDAEGNTASLNDLRGKVVLINFWATWCAPCRKEIPELIEINNELNDDAFTLIGISVDEASDINKVDMFIKEQNINYVNVLDDGRLTRQFGSIRAIPTTIIIDKEGTVRETIVGVRTKDQFMEKIKQYL